MGLRTFSFAISAVLCAIFSGSASTLANATAAGLGDGAPVRIAVLSAADFNSDRAAPDEIARLGLPSAFADSILFHLQESGRFEPVERAALRAVVREQAGGHGHSYLDRTLDKAIEVMDSVDPHGGVLAADKRIPLGSGVIGSTGALADYNDLLKDMQSLGTALRADYLVVGSLDTDDTEATNRSLPYGAAGRSVTETRVRAHVNLRIVDVKKGTVVGVVRFNTRMTRRALNGDTGGVVGDVYDELGGRAARGILDTTFPARIVNTTPLVVSRGTNDGVALGNVFRVVHEGAAIKGATGLTIGHLSEEMGRVRVTSAEKNISVVEWLDGKKGAQIGDFVIADSDLATSAAATAAGGASLNPATATSKGLPTIAVGLVKSLSTAKKLDQEHVFAFTDTLLSRLAQTHRFRVIDRQEVDQLLNEQVAQALTENAELPGAMGTLAGADYLLYGSLANFSIREDTVSLVKPSSSTQVTRKTGFLNGNMRVVDARTGAILESRTIDVKRSVPIAAADSRTVSLLADAYADVVVSSLVNAIYPMKVAHVTEGGQIYVNRGEDGGLAIGQVLDVYRSGGQVLDPDTGVVLGKEELMIGQIELTEIDENRSKARVLGGAKPGVGDLLKVAAVQADAKKGGRSGSALGGVRGKATLAIGDVRLNHSARTSADLSVDLGRLSDALVEQFDASNRFRVMERQQVDRVLGEQLLQAAMSDDEVADSLAHLDGADYFVDGEVTNFYSNLKRETIPYTSETQLVGDGVAEGTFRILDVHSGAVVAVKSVRVSGRFVRVHDRQEAATMLLQRFATEAASQLVLSLYPIKVLGAAGNNGYFVNRGADARLQVGDRYEVFRLGNELIDPDTGIPFGNDETSIGMVEIVAVEPSRSRVRVLSGGALASGDVLRQAIATATKPAVKTVRPNW